ncbi:MAG: ABC transporter ATP-binding protein [Candidatus Methylomirabilales bacterium]
MSSPASSATPLIELRGVEKVYISRDGPVHSLRAVSLEVPAGEFLSIVGPSGCGKSTLLKIVAGLLPATGGEARFDGRRIQGPPEGMGIVFQSPVLLGWRTVLDNILLQAEVRGLPLPAARTRALELIQTVGLGGFERKYPWELSGGMQQRAAICRALLHDPSMLLMDEPFGALDAMTREMMDLELQRIWSATKKTVLFVTHSIPEAVLLSDRVLVMTERPGSVAAIYPIALPRPRSFHDMGAPGFVALTNAIRAHFYSQGSVDH